jgi:hypothetical protein
VNLSHVENGLPPAYEQRLETMKLMFERAYGRPAVHMTVDQTNLSTKKVVYEVRWLPPDPNDHSKVIEPEP